MPLEVYLFRCPVLFSSFLSSFYPCFIWKTRRSPSVYFLRSYSEKFIMKVLEVHMGVGGHQI